MKFDPQCIHVTAQPHFGVQVKHELSHYLDVNKLGFEAYKDLGRAGRAISVLERLQGNRVWGQMNEAERVWSIDYATGIK